jgi:hypothetical protein
MFEMTEHKLFYISLTWNVLVIIFFTYQEYTLIKIWYILSNRYLNFNFFFQNDSTYFGYDKFGSDRTK